MPDVPSSKLDLACLCEPPGMLGLTPSAGQDLVDAAAVCFEACGHYELVALGISGWQSRRYELTFPRVSDQTRRTYSDLAEATQKGACAVAITVLCDLGDYVVLERARLGSGIDYWLGNEDAPVDNFLKAAARLEVSGILRETSENSLERRVSQECRQTRQSDGSMLKAFVAVVEFSQPVAKVVKR